MCIHDSRLQWLEGLLADRFGHKWKLALSGDALTLELAGQQGQIRFDNLESLFVETGLSHGLGCGWWRVESPWTSALGEPQLPMPSSRSLPAPLVELTGNTASINYDILGLAFWAMNRLEEVGAQVVDAHGRFPASQSHALTHGYLDRPVVDEWLDVLRQVIQAVWPQIKLKRREFRLVLSHDVDRPSRYGFASFPSLVRAVGGDVLHRRDLKALLVGPWVRLATRNRLHPLDPFNSFHWIMDVAECAGVQSTFNFICSPGQGALEADYRLDHPAIRSLIRDIHQRGHLIGLHPSYQAVSQPGRIAEEFQTLRNLCESEGVQQASWGGRMHYLRWSHPRTLQEWEDAGLDYDSTLGYAEHVGFRCGTCIEFTPYNVVDERPFSIKERPLVAMEGSVVAPQYMNISRPGEAERVLMDVRSKCERLGGDFTLLWHNSELCNRNRRHLFCEASE